MRAFVRARFRVSIGIEASRLFVLFRILVCLYIPSHQMVDDRLCVSCLSDHHHHYHHHPLLLLYVCFRYSSRSYWTAMNSNRILFTPPAVSCCISLTLSLSLSLSASLSSLLSFFLSLCGYTYTSHVSCSCYGLVFRPRLRDSHEGKHRGDSQDVSHLHPPVSVGMA